MSVKNFLKDRGKVWVTISDTKEIPLLGKGPFLEPLKILNKNYKYLIKNGFIVKKLDVEDIPYKEHLICILSIKLIDGAENEEDDIEDNVIIDDPNMDTLRRQLFDKNNNGIIDLSENIQGYELAGILSYYGTDANGKIGFHALPEGTKDLGNLKNDVVQINKCISSINENIHALETSTASNKENFNNHVLSMNDKLALVDEHSNEIASINNSIQSINNIINSSSSCDQIVNKLKEDVAIIQESIKNLSKDESEIECVKKSLEELEESLKTLPNVTKDIEKLKSDVEKLNNAKPDGETVDLTDINKQISLLNEKITTINDVTVKDINNKITKLSNDLNKVVTFDPSEINGKIQKLEADVKRLSEGGSTSFDPSEIKSQIQEIQNTIKTLQPSKPFDPSEINEKIKVIEGKIEKINVEPFDPSTINEKISQLEKQIAAIKPGETFNPSEINESIQSIKADIELLKKNDSSELSKKVTTLEQTLETKLDKTALAGKTGLVHANKGVLEVKDITIDDVKINGLELSGHLKDSQNLKDVLGKIDKLKLPEGTGNVSMEIEEF